MLKKWLVGFVGLIAISFSLHQNSLAASQQELLGITTDSEFLREGLLLLKQDNYGRLDSLIVQGINFPEISYEQIAPGYSYGYAGIEFFSITPKRGFTAENGGAALIKFKRNPINSVKINARIEKVNGRWVLKDEKIGRYIKSVHLTKVEVRGKIVGFNEPSYQYFTADELGIRR